jgi:hypothetical protein
MSNVMTIGMFEAPEMDRGTESDRPAPQQVPQEQTAEVRTFRPIGGWDQESFAREQIRGLVRQIFFPRTASPVRQVVFSAVDTDTDVRRICRRVGETLALEAASSIAVAGEYPKVYEAKPSYERHAEKGASQLRQTATRMGCNLWLVPLDRAGHDCFTSASLRAYLGKLRQEFEYSIVESAAGASSEAAAMAQLSDGIILVVSAHRTRRAAARMVKSRLESAEARILGTVLSERVFPIPEKVYRRL